MPGEQDAMAGRTISPSAAFGGGWGNRTLSVGDAAIPGMNAWATETGKLFFGGA
jgi:hypothetical protein